jgi:PAS domain S-box-containing protein
LKKGDWDDFVDYEKKVDSNIGKRQMISLCPYFLDMCSAADIIDVAFNHQFALIKREGKWERIENSGLKTITENKQEDEALRQSEQRVRVKFEDILSPSREMANLELADIIDAQAIQSLMDDFYKLVQVPMGLNDLKGNVLVGVGWQDICTKFHRFHPEACKHCVESNIKLSTGISPGEFKMYKCKNNMWDIVTPIMVGGQHIGDIFAGQFFFEDEPLDYELFRSQAKKYGFNEEEYIAALEKVPRLSREAVDTGMDFFMTFANMISQLSYSNVKLARSLSERDTLVYALRESEKRERARSDELAAVLDAVPVAVYIARDPQVLRITGNRLSYEWLQLPVGTNFSKSAPEGERPETFKLFKNGVEIPPANMPSQMAAAGIEISDCELDIVSADGKIRHVLGNARPLRDEQGNLRGSISAFIDITERKKAEEALKQANDNLDKLVKERTAELEQAYKSLKESEKGLAEAQKMAHIGNWKWNIVTDEKYWSDEIYRIFGRSPQEFDITYDAFLSYVHPDDRDFVDNATKAALKGKTYAIDYRIVSAGGEELIVHSQGEVIFDEKDYPVQMLGTVQDITERRKAEQELELSEERYRSFIQNFKGIAFQLDKDLKLEFMKGNLKEITGYSEEEIIFKKPWGEIILPEDLPLFLKDSLAAKNSPSAYEGEIHYRIRSKDGRIKWLHEIYQKIPGKIGGTDKYQGVIYDITERKQAENSLANVEIARKQEIHHRIKNNLQVISSLLDLQAEKFRDRECVEDSEVLKAFRESQDRVMSIALIHEELHEGRGNDTLNFSLYIKRLVKNLFQTYRLGNSDTRLNIDLEEDIFFDMDTAVPLGIIINELVSNSLKYAFPGKDKGLIQIKLCKEESGVCTKNIGSEKVECEDTNFILTVSDNGVGIPEGFNSESSASLGLQLVSILVDQLGGKLELKRDSGTGFIIRFIVAEKNMD